MSSLELLFWTWSEETKTVMSSVGFYPHTMDFRCPNSGYGFVPENVQIFVGSPISYIFT